jgi:hypothetical protein
VTKLLFFLVIIKINIFHVSHIEQNWLDKTSSLDFAITPIMMLVANRLWFCSSEWSRQPSFDYSGAEEKWQALHMH